MAACNETEWTITLRLDGALNREETISFRGINITGGVIVGKVYDGPEDPANLMSTLRGVCSPAMATGHPDMSHLQFVFDVRDIRNEVFVVCLNGVAYLPPDRDKKEFRGEFRTYKRYTGDAFSFTGDVATLPGRLDILSFDEGDTGTGNGNQT